MSKTYSIISEINHIFDEISLNHEKIEEIRNKNKELINNNVMKLVLQANDVEYEEFGNIYRNNSYIDWNLNKIRKYRSLISYIKCKCDEEEFYTMKNFIIDKFPILVVHDSITSHHIGIKTKYLQLYYRKDIDNLNNDKPEFDNISNESFAKLFDYLGMI